MLRSLSIALCLGLATPAGAFVAQNGLTVSAVGAQAFHVPWRGQSGTPAFWCAAGDYALRELRLPPTADIYRYDAPRRGSGEGITFGLDPARAQQTGLLRLFGGRGVSIASARTLCDGIGVR